MHFRHAAPVTTPALIRLRPVTEADLPLLYEHQLDPEASAMAAFPTRDRDAFMAHWGRVMQNETAVNRTIVADGEVAGYISSWRQDGHREVGYWLDRRFWGRGVATAALAALLAELAERPIHAHVVRHNAGSIRVLEKCGFERDGEAVVDDEPDDGVVEWLYVLR
jgi:RimJ/RimL family protein N-acetyltransferase